MKRICTAWSNLLVMPKVPCLRGTRSHGATLRHLKWKEGENVSLPPVFAHQAPGRPNYLLNTRDLPDTLTALQVWRHCRICTSLVSCLVGLLFSFPDEEMEPGWQWRSWAQAGPQVVKIPSPVPHTYSPHPASKMSDSHICSGEEGKGDLA